MCLPVTTLPVPMCYGLPINFKAQFVSAENVFCKTFSAFAGVCCDVK